MANSAFNLNTTLPDASTTTKGVVELATDAETTTGTDTTRAITPANAKVELDKKANISSLGEYVFDHVASGLVLVGTGYGSTLAWSLPVGVVYINGKRLTVAAATGSVTASRDTYFDLLDPGTGTVATLVNTGGNIVTNNADSPALAANSVRIGIITSGANILNVASVNQGQEDRVLPIATSIAYAVTDSLGNLICPRDPTRKLLGYRQILVNFSTANTSVTLITGLTVPVIIPTGRKVCVTLSGNRMSVGVADNSFINIFETSVVGTRIQESIVYSAVANANVPVNINRTYTPPSLSMTYVGSYHVGSSTGTITSTASAPLSLKIELV